ncbi:MAG TPA: hypothetical protein VGX91_10180, partial [Candidatus Cybelea sp.]|nr:hypothetical protein [Candidatus Cybelea sp.]
MTERQSRSIKGASQISRKALLTTQGGIAAYLRKLDAEHKDELAKSQRRDELIARGLLADLDDVNSDGAPARPTYSGGSGNRSISLRRVRYCSNCDRQYRRVLVDEPRRANGKYSWLPGCECGAEPEIKAGQVQQLGAKPRGGGRNSGGGRPRSRRARNGNSEIYIASAGGLLTEQERVESEWGTLGEPLDFSLPPLLALFVEQSAAPDRGGQSRFLRYILYFLRCTEDYKRGDCERWIVELEEFERSVKSRRRPQLFGTVKGVPLKARFPAPFIAGLADVFHLTIDDEHNPTAYVTERFG